MGNQTENQTEHEQEIGIVRDFMRVRGAYGFQCSGCGA